ncbi:MAG: replication initiator protein A [Lachnospiraceae bacterium]|nr:replication initiator protein A [Lachnospiraceae bacterium]
MGDSLRFDYYYGIEAEQFSFYRVPRLLIKDERFKELSSDAKLLYGLMLDRMALSIKNGWFDEENRAYIHYTLDNIMEDLGCAREKCSKVIAELDSKKGIGLIEKKRQGLGKPDIIYVKNFATLEARTEPEKQPESPDNTDVSTEVRKPNFKEFDNQTSRNSETELAEVREPNGSYNNNNYNNMSDNNPINLSMQGEAVQAAQENDAMDEVSAYIELIKQNIEYEHFMNYGEWRDKALYEELYEVICEVVCVKRKTVRIAGEDYPYELVKSKFLKLDSTHLQYVIECMQNTTTKVGNIKAYMVTALYNAPTTINHYYQQEVQHDMYGGGWLEKGIV